MSEASVEAHGLSQLEADLEDLSACLADIVRVDRKRYKQCVDAQRLELRRKVRLVDLAAPAFACWVLCCTWPQSEAPWLGSSARACCSHKGNTSVMHSQSDCRRWKRP
jgi:hypothetical protein